MKPGQWEREGSPHALPIVCPPNWQRRAACSVEVGPTDLGRGGSLRDFHFANGKAEALGGAGARVHCGFPSAADGSAWPP